MGKIIISESQYRKVKKVLIENAINTSLLNEGSNELSYTVKSDKVYFESADGKTDPELTIFKGAKFVPDNKGNLVAKTLFAFSDSINGLITKGPYTWDTAGVDQIKQNSYREPVYYNCSTFKFKVPSRSNYSYYAENSPAPELGKELNKLCQRAKSFKSSTGLESVVGGGSFYKQANDYIVKSDKGSQLKLPKSTTVYVYKEGKNGATFKTPQGWGWFSCPSKTFLVNKVTYKDAKGYLANNIFNSICKPASSVTTDLSNNSSNNSSQTQQPGNNVGGSGSGGAGPVASSSVVSDMANYV